MRQILERISVLMFSAFCLSGFFFQTTLPAEPQQSVIPSGSITRGMQDSADHPVVINVSRNLFDWVPIIALAGTWLISMGYNKRRQSEMTTRLAELDAEVQKHRDECNQIPKSLIVSQMANIDKRLTDLHESVVDLTSTQSKMNKDLLILVGRQAERDQKMKP